MSFSYFNIINDVMTVDAWSSSHSSLCCLFQVAHYTRFRVYFCSSNAFDTSSTAVGMSR